MFEFGTASILKGCNFIHQSINRCQCDSMRFREVLLHGHPAGQVDELGPLDARFLISASDGPFPPTSGSRSLLAIGNQSPRYPRRRKVPESGRSSRRSSRSLVLRGLEVRSRRVISARQTICALIAPASGDPLSRCALPIFLFMARPHSSSVSPPPVRAWMNWRMTTVPKKTSGRSSWSWPTPSRTRP